MTGRAVAEALADVLGLVVGARVDRGDPVQRADLDVADDPGHRRALRQRGDGGRPLRPGLLARRLVVVVLVVTVVALVVLGEPEVHHRLAQRPSHCELPWFVHPCTNRLRRVVVARD